MLDKFNNILTISIAFGILINLVVPFILRPFATKEQIKPPNGADKLPFIDQLMHMFVHHAQVPVTSSIIIAVIVGLSVYLAKLFT